MRPDLDRIVQAILYEGYILYPYRASSAKNQRERFTFGRVYPRDYSEAVNGAEPAQMQTECLVANSSGKTELQICIRFLQPMWREIGVPSAPLEAWTDGSEPPLRFVSDWEANGNVHRAWVEAVEREVTVPSLKGCSVELQHPFTFPAERRLEPIRDASGKISAFFVRQTETVCGVIDLGVEIVSGALSKATVRICNDSPLADGELADQDAILRRTFASTHTVLHAREAEFVSLMDPPPELKQAAEACRNTGTWPVLIGDEVRGDRDTLLSSPIILYDYPRIAPESPGDLFDGTEIDELLTLRVMTMTDEEKHEMRNLDDHARRLLERTEALPPEDLLKMHGSLRGLRPFDDEVFGTSQPLRRVLCCGTWLAPGDRVRIQPKERADVMDMVIAGRTAIVEAIEQDAERRIHLAVVLEDDPGQDLGHMRQTGHRFFYGLHEVELLTERGLENDVDGRRA